MKKFVSNKCGYKALSALLIVAILCVSFFDVLGVILSAKAETLPPYIKLDGEKVEEITLVEDAKLRLEAVANEQPMSYRWQIKDPTQEDRWVDISDSYSRYLWVTNALVGSMLTEDSTTSLRCRIQTKEKDIFTTPVKVTLSLNVSLDEDIYYQSTKSNNAVVMKSASRAINKEHTTNSIVINYLFDNNTMAFEPYGASVATGSDFKATIKSPSVVGYDPFRRVGDDYIDASVVELDLKNIQENITINVIYEPALVNYTVHHHLQNLLDDDYSVNYDLITTGKALTGSTVGDGLALSETELPGFKALAYEKLIVAADGSTVIEIRYDRNYYLIDFDMSGGYGAEPVYTRYGSTVGVNTPIRHGYIFDGWELVSYNGQTPTLEQQSMYALGDGKTIESPAANLRYKARWITQETTYTMVFWQENANDNGYTYWGYLDNLVAMSGSYVDGQDWISKVSGIGDEQYFTFNELKTDKNVLVEGDGSTVVNVYYTRKFYKITFKANSLCGIREKHTHNDTDCYDMICDSNEHVHDENCSPILECTIPEHTEHTSDCINCGYEEHLHGSVGCDCKKQEHTHSVSCWNNIGSVQSKAPNGAPSRPTNGQIYRRSTGINRSYYIYLYGKWYVYSGKGVSSGDIVDPSCGYDNEHTHGTDCSCNKEEHTHTDKCYRDTFHTHSASCYKYSCGIIVHTHDSKCRRLKCGIAENHSHNNTCKRASSSNIVKVVYAKYGASLKEIWPITDENNKEYNNGERWSPSDSSYYSQVLVYIDNMTPDDFTLTLSTSSANLITMNYYLQVLPGDTSGEIVTYDGKQYKLDNTIKAKYNYVTEAEDFFDIIGFTQFASNPKFSGGQINNSQVSFYYNRITDHYLEFNNNGTVLDNKKVHGIMYGELLSEYNFVPEYPSNLEPNAYNFEGWYTSPGCFDGTEVNWETLTMPEGDLMLYAKWSPITHTVRVFKTADLSEQIGDSQIVDHKAFAIAPAGNITNGNYVFQGWFYKDVVNGVVVEKAFTFSGIPVLKDMDIYAKWSSHVSVPYKIYYKIKDTDIEIAAPTYGNAIAGHNKTFDAKAGDQLYKDYQIGYYPETNSHTITMSVDGTHEFTFYYVFVESMPYKVQYVNVETGAKLYEDKRVMDNSLSVVTETFVHYDKMMPDAYQKRLVLSADKTDEDNDGIFDANVITFYYNSDEEHAFYRVVHYIQNILGDGYREYRSEETTGIIGNKYAVSALTLTGFEYNSKKTTVNGVVVPSVENTVTTTLTENGALIELYYDRQTFNYSVYYVDSSTQSEIHTAKNGTALFGEQIVEYARNLEGKGYELVSDSAKTLTISANEEYNIIEFFYQEKTVALKYQIVGPAGCGVLSQDSENITAISGLANGSYPIVNNGFVFLGWYTDVNCTNPVDDDLVDKNNNRLSPQKTGEVWTATTYYAKFAALETDLTITTKSTSISDENQAFLFHIKGKAGTKTEKIDMVVSVVGNNSVTVAKLPTGDYTITELTNWSWRYENSLAQREVTLEYNNGSNSLLFDNSRTNGKWLDANAETDNKF